MGTFSNIATGLTAYNTWKTNKTMAQVQQSMAHFQEMQAQEAQVQAQQKAMRDAIFQVRQSLADDIPLLQPDAALFNLEITSRQLALNGINADAFSEMQDKEAAYQVIKKLKQELEQRSKDLPQERVTEIGELARINFALPVVQKLSRVVKIRSLLPPPTLRQRFMALPKALQIGVAIGLGIVIAPIAKISETLAGLVVAGLIGTLIYQAVTARGRVWSRWNEVKQLAGNDIDVQQDATLEDANAYIAELEGELPAIGEAKAANPQDYTRRAEEMETKLDSGLQRYRLA